MLAGCIAVTRGTGSVTTARIDKEKPRNAPSYGRDEAYDFEQRAAARKLHDYYRVPPYGM